MPAFETTCVHYQGLMEIKTCDRIERCDAGIEFESFLEDGVKRLLDCLPCYRDNIPCEYRQYPTQEQIQKREREIERVMRGLSQCCGAPVDERAVISSGRFAGHGPRWCSKCGKLAWQV